MSKHDQENNVTPRQADKVLHASTNGLYVEAQKLDRGHALNPCPPPNAPGTTGDVPDATTQPTPGATTHATSDKTTHTTPDTTTRPTPDATTRATSDAV